MRTPLFYSIAFNTSTNIIYNIHDEEDLVRTLPAATATTICLHLKQAFLDSLLVTFTKTIKVLLSVSVELDIQTIEKLCKTAAKKVVNITVVSSGQKEIIEGDFVQFNHDKALVCGSNDKILNYCSPSALLNEEERMYLSGYKSNGSPKADLLFICAPLLLKEDLTCEEDELLELSLSGIYNYLNPYMKKMYQEKLNRLPPSTTTTTNSVAETITGICNLLDSEKDMDGILYKVQLEKIKLTKEKLRHSDKYKALSILEKMIEDTQLWNEAGDEQEMTFYRLFASYLDALLLHKLLLLILKY